MDYLLRPRSRARLGDRQDDHPVAASPDRREGSGGVGDRRRAAGDRQRGRRRAVASRRPQHRHPDHAPEGLGDPPREGHLLGRRDRALDVRAGRRARGGRPALRLRDGRRGRAADLGAAGRLGIVHPDGSIEGWVGGGAPSPSSSARRSAPWPTASHGCFACRGTPGRGPPRRRHHRTGHDLPFGRHAGDLRGTASACAASCGSPARRRSPARSSARSAAGFG